MVGNGTVTRDGAHLFEKLPDPLLLARIVANAQQDMQFNTGWLIPPWGLNRFPGARWGEGCGPGRVNLAEECGYPTDQEMDATWFKNLYNRYGLAARVVDIWPDECWAAYPDLNDSAEPGITPWKESWDDLVNNKLIFHYLHRIDRLSRLCQYGILFLGLDDGGKLSDPPRGIDRDTGERLPGFNRKYKLNYLMPFDQTLVRVSSMEKNKYSPRYNRPKYYHIQFNTTNLGVGPDGAQPADGPVLIENKVHWTRVLHVADNLQNSEIFGIPSLYTVANYLHDAHKVAGSSAEMFYKGGFPGYAFETYPDLAGEATIDDDSLNDQMELYQRRLKRYLATVGGRWNSLQPQVANPDKHLEWYIKLICMAIGVPARIFMGSEAGHLASMKDDDAWRTRCNGRQTKYLEPKMIRPLIDRLTVFGVLPKTRNVYCNWRDLRAMSDKDRVDIALKKAQTLMQYKQGNVEQIFPIRLFLTMVLNLTEEEADAVEAELAKNPPPEPMEMQLAKLNAQQKAAAAGPAGGGRTGNPSKAQVGKPADSNPEGTPTRAKPGSAARRLAVHQARTPPSGWTKSSG